MTSSERIETCFHSYELSKNQNKTLFFLFKSFVYFWLILLEMMVSREHYSDTTLITRLPLSYPPSHLLPNIIVCVSCPLLLPLDLPGISLSHTYEKDHPVSVPFILTVLLSMTSFNRTKLFSSNCNFLLNPTEPEAGV